MKDNIKLIVLKVCRLLVRVLFLIPMKENRILFSSYLGEGYSCSPKALSEYIEKNYPDKYELIWTFKNPDKFKNIYKGKTVPYKGLKWIISVITSKVVIVNNGAIWIPRRKGQLIIETWHGGGCYKKVAMDKDSINNLVKVRTEISVNETNLFLSSSEYFSERVIRESFHYNGQILNSGMPRNDVLFHDPDIKKRSEFFKQYHIAENSHIVLFAPTWREVSLNSEKIDAKVLCKAIKERFGWESVVLLGRGHHTENSLNDEGFFDVSSYPDMQDLLLISDILITDYSSSIWDYSFTGKPCFLYTPDLETYSKNPGFDKDIFEWGFPVCRSNEELYNKITGFDETEYRKAMEKHHIDLNSYENSTACKQVAEYIEQFCKS